MISEEEKEKEKEREKELYHLQRIYDSVFENKTTLYSEHIEAIEDDLIEKFGDDYKDVKTLFEYINDMKLSDGRLFTEEEILKIKINRMLSNLQAIYSFNEQLKRDEEKIERISKYIW